MYKIYKDIRFTNLPGGSSLGASVCISLDNAKFVRIECRDDGLYFTSSNEVKDDGCFYSNYIKGQTRVFVPEKIISAYTDAEGRPLLGRTVPRKFIDGGYAAVAKKVKPVDFSGISFEEKLNEPIGYTVKKEFSIYSNNSIKSVLPKPSKIPYFIVDLYYGETAGVIITPTFDITGIQHKKNLRQLFGGKNAYMNATKVRYYVNSSEQDIIPLGWYKQFLDYEIAKYTISENDGVFLVQMQGKCIVDEAETHSAEFNSGERYLCADCTDDKVLTEDGEWVPVMAELIRKYKDLEYKYEKLKAESAKKEAEADLRAAKRLGGKIPVEEIKMIF